MNNTTKNFYIYCIYFNNGLTVAINTYTEKNAFIEVLKNLAKCSTFKNNFVELLK